MKKDKVKKPTWKRLYKDGEFNYQFFTAAQEKEIRKHAEKLVKLVIADACVDPTDALRYMTEELHMHMQDEVYRAKYPDSKF